MKHVLKSALILLLVGFGLTSASAQVRVNVHGQRPYWGPAVGPEVEYYYLPEIDGYYDLYSQRYLYQDEYGYWVSSPALPAYYSHYDPRYFHPVVIQYVGRQPWGYIRSHRDYCHRRGMVPGRYYYGGGRYYEARPAYGYHRRGQEHFDRDEHRQDHDRDDRDGRDHERWNNHRGNGAGREEYGRGQARGGYSSSGNEQNHGQGHGGGHGRGRGRF